MLTTFFDGEIISKKYPFLTRKWDADEDVDRKHWVSITQTQSVFERTVITPSINLFRVNLQRSRINTRRRSTRTISITTT